MTEYDITKRYARVIDGKVIDAWQSDYATCDHVYRARQCMESAAFGFMADMTKEGYVTTICHADENKVIVEAYSNTHGARETVEYVITPR